MKGREFTYRTKELCLDEQGNVLTQKVLNFGPDPILAGAQAGTYSYRKMKQIERNPAGFLKDLGFPEAQAETQLDVQLLMVLQEKGIEKEYFLYSQNESNSKNLKREKRLIKKFKAQRSKELIALYKNLFESSPTPDQVPNKLFPVPCYFKTKKIKINQGGEQEIVDVREFRPENFDNYVKMQKAAKEYHFCSISNESDLMEQFNNVLNGSTKNQGEYCELYLVLIEQNEEHETLRLRDNQMNLDGFDIDNYLETLCMEDNICFLKAKLKHVKKKKISEKSYGSGLPEWLLNVISNFKSL